MATGSNARSSRIRVRDVGRLDDKDILRLNQAALVFLGLAVSPRAGQTT